MSKGKIKYHSVSTKATSYLERGSGGITEVV